MITHHPDPATLLSYGAGSLGCALSSAIAAHIEFCDTCRQELDFVEVMGGAFIATLQREPLARTVPGLTLRRVEAQVIEPCGSGGALHFDTVPTVLAQFVGNTLSDIQWQRVSLGVGVYELKIPGLTTGNLRLIKLSRGCLLPRARCNGSELTMVLTGFLHTDHSRFGPGDILQSDGRAATKISADEFEECIVLNASEKQYRSAGLLSRLVHRFTR